MRRFSDRLGQALRRARKARSLTQEALAARIGCSTRTVERAERGTTLPRDEIITAWEEVTEVSLLPS